jgi:hypothetical protein
MHRGNRRRLVAVIPACRRKWLSPLAGCPNLTNPPRIAGAIAAVGFLVVAGYQVLLALGIAFSGAAWGGATLTPAPATRQRGIRGCSRPGRPHRLRSGRVLGIASAGGHLSMGHVGPRWRDGAQRARQLCLTNRRRAILPWPVGTIAGAALLRHHARPRASAWLEGQTGRCWPVSERPGLGAMPLAPAESERPPQLLRPHAR